MLTIIITGILRGLLMNSALKSGACAVSELVKIFCTSPGALVRVTADITTAT